MRYTTEEGPGIYRQKYYKDNNKDDVNCLNNINTLEKTKT